MKRYVLGALLAGGIASSYFALRNRTPVAPAGGAGTAPVAGTAGRIGPDYLYPNPQLTAGKADTLDAAALDARYSDHCPKEKPTCTYSEAHRSVPEHEKTGVYDEYNVARDRRNAQHGEVDHFYPLCAGGSNDISNLWYQPAANEWNGRNFGYHQKDVLEAAICRQIKAGSLSPQEAYSRLTSDWVKFYLDLGLDKAATQSSAVE